MAIFLGINGFVPAGVISKSLQKLLIILARHIDIDIVVPGDIPLVADGSNQCATRQKITKVMSLAETMNLVEDAHLYLTQFLNVFYLSHFLKSQTSNLKPQLLPNNHFLKNGLMRRMLEVIMLKPIMTKPSSTESKISTTKLWGWALKNSPIWGRSGMNRKWMR